MADDVLFLQCEKCKSTFILLKSFGGFDSRECPEGLGDWVQNHVVECHNGFMFIEKGCFRVISEHVMTGADHTEMMDARAKDPAYDEARKRPQGFL